MNLGLGQEVWVRERAWPADMDPEERTARNAAKHDVVYPFTVTELEWTKPHQRLIVRGTDDAGRPVAFTRHELQINGASNG